MSNNDNQQPPCLKFAGVPLNLDEVVKTMTREANAEALERRADEVAFIASMPSLAGTFIPSTPVPQRR